MELFVFFWLIEYKIRDQCISEVKKCVLIVDLILVPCQSDDILCESDENDLNLDARFCVFFGIKSKKSNVNVTSFILFGNKFFQKVDKIHKLKNKSSNNINYN